MKNHCPACGFSNPLDTIVCELCGEDLDSDRKAQESFSHRVPTAVRQKPDKLRTTDGTDTHFRAHSNDGDQLETSLTIPDSHPDKQADDVDSGDLSHLPPISAVGGSSSTAEALSPSS